MADPDAFRLLYRTHHERVCAYLARRVEPGAVEDLAAETFLVAWRRQRETPAHALPWLLNIAGKCLANQRRGHDRRQALAARLTAAAAPAGGVEEEADRRAQRRALVAGLQALPAADCELLLLRHWDGLAPREIAVVLELSPVATRARLHRATRRLQRELLAALEREDVPAVLDMRGTPHAT